jgi:hypothetical protein
VTGDFTVDADELRRMSGQASSLHSELSDQQLPSDALSGIAGSHDVEDAYRSFVNTWSDGLYYARQHLDALAQRLSSAADAYLQADCAIQKAATGSGRH